MHSFVRKVSTILLISGLFFAAACGDKPSLIGSQQVLVRAAGELPVPEGAGESYKIGAYDRLMIEIVQLERPALDVQVDPGGNISIPLVGSMPAMGKTPGQLEADIERALRARFVRDPMVSVNAKDIVSQTVTVDGEVKQPGAYPVPTKTTLTRAVAAAKGVSEFAKIEEVVVYRTVGGQQYAALYDLRGIRQGLYGDPDIYPNDSVVVGTANARRVFRELLQASAGLTAPLVAVIANSGR